ncbi:transglutaminase domain-containing protein [Candidatus Micrarchaeota archaeon]|nr:transglutaminase domain-containing protein [Candidatus Micrarchaeota archaeon]
MLFLVITIIVANTGYMKAEINKTINIKTDEKISDIEIDAIFLLNTSYQKVIEMKCSDECRFERNNTEIRVIFEIPEVEDEKQVWVWGLVEIEYEDGFEQNPELGGKPVNGSGLTLYTEEMQQKAIEITREAEGQVDTAGKLIEWVHNNLEYDLGYWGTFESAEKIFQDKKGVCVEYSHLFLALAKSIGFEGNVVSGYVKGEEGWQSHSWAEIKIDGKWISVDPTFFEMGILSGEHIAMANAEDQKKMGDQMSARGGRFEMESDVKITELNSYERDGPIDIDFVYESTEQKLEIYMKNTKNRYLPVCMKLVIDENVHGNDYSFILMNPGELKTVYYEINESALEDNFIHTIPFMIKTGYNEIDGSIIIEKKGKSKSEIAIEKIGEGSVDLNNFNDVCSIPLAFLLLVGLFGFDYRN